MALTLYAIIDGVECATTGENIVSGIRAEVSGKNKIGRAEIELTYPSVPGYTWRGKREVRIYETDGTDTRALFGGFIDTIRSYRVIGTSRTYTTLGCQDYNVLLDTIIWPADSAADTVASDTFADQIADVVQTMQFNGAGSVNRTLEATDYVENLTGVTNLPTTTIEPGESLRQVLQKIMNNAQADTPALRPRFHVNLLPEPLPATGIQTSLVVYDGAAPPAPTNHFSDSPTGAQKGIMEYERTLDAAQPLTTKRQSRANNLSNDVYTGEDATASLTYYNPYINDGIGAGSTSGHWTDLPVDDSESTDATEAQDFIDRLVTATSTARETIRIKEQDTLVRPGQAVQLTWAADDLVAATYEVTSVEVQFPTEQNTDRHFYILTLGLPKLGLFDDPAGGIAGGNTGGGGGGGGTPSNALLQGGNAFGADLTVGTNDAQDVVIETGGTERVRVLDTGEVGIGVNPPDTNTRLDVQISDPGASIPPIALAAYATKTDANARGAYGAQIGAEISDSSGTQSEVVGVLSEVLSTGAATTTALTAFEAELFNGGGGTVTTATGVKVNPPTGGDPITTAYGVYVESQAVSGVTTAWAGYFVGDVNITGDLTVGGAGLLTYLHEHVTGEDHTAETDGVKTNFITANEFGADTVAVYLNGLRLVPVTDYTEDGTYDAVTLSVAPAGGDNLILDYIAA